ncbi:hypothetical protein HPP92_007265 [Vanilla planifolia]|uniref:Uncharacterized protein n=1 Tax=Vanilla planifolia TaxID=51239 RepID=A0A835V5Q6_VANPL|nr:hypothetical protein HPP92_007265 [Vanilla planifolia]
MVAISATLPVPEGCTFGAIRTPIPRIGGDNLRFGRSRSSWIVRTESNVRKEKIRKPDPPCMVCAGTGRVNCRQCEGRGRTNCVNLAVLPKGQWPRWCKVCGGSGLGYCNRCLGTGEYNDIMGFHFMKMDSNSSQH